MRDKASVPQLAHVAKLGTFTCPFNSGNGQPVPGIRAPGILQT